MNKKILAKTLLPIAIVALLGGGIATSLILSSCGSKKDPSDYIGNMDGTNWKGYAGSGSVEMDLNEDDMTATIFTNTDYVAENLIIPKYVSDDGKFYKVTSIGDEAFGGCGGLTGSLTIGSNVTSIGAWVFGDCTGLTGSLTIPNSVTDIGPYAFGGCSGFTGSLTIPNNVTSISNGAFNGCRGFTGSLTIPSGVTSIGFGAFGDCINLTGSLTIPSSVESIGQYAFENCGGLRGSLTIPDSVTSIGGSAFYGCSGFTNITLVGFRIEPSWDGSDIFYDWNDSSSNCTVSTSGGTLTAAQALAYLIAIGLPDNWTPAS